MTPNDLPDMLRRRADAPTFRSVDLDTVVRSGTRLRRRRRAGTAAAGLALAAVIGGGVTMLATQDTPQAVDPAGSVGAADRPLSWATGDVLHVGDTETTVADGLRAYVEVGDRFAVIGSDGLVRLVGPDGTGEVLDPEAPPAEGAFVKVVTDGRWIGWITAAAAGDRATVHYYDTDTGRVVRQGLQVAEGRDEFSSLVSLDAGTAYLVGADGPMATTLPQDGADSQEYAIRALSGPLPGGETFVDARSGTLVRYEDGVRAGSTWGSARPIEVGGQQILESRGVLSPDGSAFAPDADTIRVVTLDGSDVTPDVGAEYAFFSTVYRWLDDDTVAVIAAEAEEGPYALLRCEITDGTCTTETTLASPDGLQLPVGTPVG